MAEIATFWRQLQAGNAYVRCDVPASAMPAAVFPIMPPHLTVSDDYLPVFDQRGDTAIWPYPGNDVRAKLMRYQQEDMGLRVLVEVDDNYLVTFPTMRAGQWSKRHKGDDRYSLEYHRHICTWADGVIVSTAPLADAYADVNENVYLCPNSVQPADWPERLPPVDDKFRIGWAASPSHIVDAPLVRRAMEWAARQPGVEVVLFGFQPDWRGPFKRVPWAKGLPWEDEVAHYRRKLVDLQLDVGICPLVRTEWSDGKSDLKALEYCMAGALPVVSRQLPYAEWFDRVPSVATGKDWEATIKALVSERDEVRKQASTAREYVLRERTIEKSVGHWVAACGAREGVAHGEA